VVRGEEWPEHDAAGVPWGLIGGFGRNKSGSDSLRALFIVVFCLPDGAGVLLLPRRLDFPLFFPFFSLIAISLRH
jgi:hypothetical protein